jgi:tRNA pseudouridine38-40 synthase
VSANVRLTLAYDGTDFHGWQRQRSERTVQAVVEDALARMLGEPVRLHGAGRTDSGVHALGQVANFTTDVDSIPADRWVAAINSYLPRDVQVVSGGIAPADFDSRRSAIARGYHYNLLAGSVPYPHLRRYSYAVRRRLDLVRLNRAAASLLGEHDFAVFAAAGHSSESTVRRVIAASFFPHPPYVVFRIVATSFLWRMVRSIVGTLLQIAENEAPPADIADLITSRQRDLAGQTAPARGLFLERVWYPPGAWERD